MLRKTGMMLLVGSVWMFALVPAVAAKDKVLVCHAAGRAGTTHFVTLEVPANDGGFPQGHYTEGGSTAAGHEDDYLGACIVNETTTTTTIGEPTSTTLADTTTTTGPATTSTTEPLPPTPTTEPPTTTTATQPTSTTTTLRPVTTTVFNAPPTTLTPTESTTTTAGPTTTSITAPSSTTTPLLPGPTELPRTGPDDWYPLIMATGLGLFTVGAGLLTVARRREEL